MQGQKVRYQRKMMALGKRVRYYIACGLLNFEYYVKIVINTRSIVSLVPLVAVRVWLGSCDRCDDKDDTTHNLHNHKRSTIHLTSTAKLLLLYYKQNIIIDSG